MIYIEANSLFLNNKNVSANKIFGNNERIKYFPGQCEWACIDSVFVGGFSLGCKI